MKSLTRASAHAQSQPFLAKLSYQVFSAYALSRYFPPRRTKGASARSRSTSAPSPFPMPVEEFHFRPACRANRRHKSRTLLRDVIRESRRRVLNSLTDRDRGASRAFQSDCTVRPLPRLPLPRLNYHRDSPIKKNRLSLPHAPPSDPPSLLAAGRLL